MGVSANGCHHNVSLWRGGVDEVNPIGREGDLPGSDIVFTYRKGGTNEFMDPQERVSAAGDGSCIASAAWWNTCRR